MSLFVNAGQEKKIAVVLHVSDAIGPAISDYIHRGLEDAAERNAVVAVLRLDTPGGLDSSMRSIVRDIIASPVPVIIYVAPSGARAASAGTYMLYASHLAAMAPGTNLGAATPVQLGGLPNLNPPTEPAEDKHEKDKENGEEAKQEDKDKSKDKPTPVSGDTMTKKIVNDAIAYIRSLAEMRHRNADWAEEAVREGASISSENAMKLGVIDMIATDFDDLLRQTDGWWVNVNGRDMELDTKDVILETFDPDWRTELLAVITNPNIVYILMLLGVYGLFFELANPGFVLPGVVGAICLVLALYAMQLLPVNYAGLALMVLGIAFMVAEFYAPSFGALGIGGAVGFVLGSVILFDTNGSDLKVAFPVIATVTVISAAFFFVALNLVLSAHRKPVVSGMEEMLGSIGQVIDDFDHDGYIHIHGETWQARTQYPVKNGNRVKVTAIDGLILHVEPIKEES